MCLFLRDDTAKLPVPQGFSRKIFTGLVNNPPGFMEENDMRDPKRIRAFCSRLAAAWESTPDLRFGQLMVNFMNEMLNEGIDPFFPEDHEMIGKIEDFCKRISQRYYS